ncbi:glycoside hydrolase family 5 protein [Sphingomonas sp. BGYR3]|uniref:glycoside hydrolase family 5 protein n=1 Tax=Sphingomonas sp. BGYR3 TaxID=2975483 RepID=UPI0021A84EB5|nr:glycoside hydrolase family 5 protein [Sphingomonas sp. BGYR3]MDG5487023.1 glycoside hydrolase family 5 protein [Sphingomonas sp. BGYR3]
MKGFSVRARLPLLGAAALLVAGCGGSGGSASAGPVASAPTPAPTVSPPAPPAPAPAPSPSPSPSTTATSFAAAMSPGWNLGNSLEAINATGAPFTVSQETHWGNPAVNRQLLNAVAAAGFKSVRIPVAWRQYADGSDRIGAAWLNRVQQVVDDARAAGLTVMINVHWDGGWLQPTNAARDEATARLRSYWTQIATRFRDYDDRLVFAGTNEIMVTDVYSAPTTENCTVQRGFNQAFVEAVRATGGNNANRFLVIQGYNTNIDFTVACNATLPVDSASGRLMMEVHYYDPFDFALNEKSTLWQWGSGATNPANTPNWGGEAYTDAQFDKMKTTFVDKGVPVILGEYGAILRTEYDPSGTYRTAWNRYVTRSARQRGLVPMYWDNGYTTNHAFGLFNRSTGAEAYPALIDAIVDAGK